MDTDDTASAFTVGALVEYHGSDTARHGRYRIEEVNDPIRLGDVPDEEFAEAYPEGKAYVLWPEGVPRKFGLRHLSMVNVRPASITLVGDTGTEGTMPPD